MDIWRETSICKNYIKAWTPFWNINDWLCSCLYRCWALICRVGWLKVCWRLNKDVSGSRTWNAFLDYFWWWECLSWKRTLSLRYLRKLLCAIICQHKEHLAYWLFDFKIFWLSSYCYQPLAWLHVVLESRVGRSNYKEETEKKEL